MVMGKRHSCMRLRLLRRLIPAFKPIVANLLWWLLLLLLSPCALDHRWVLIGNVLGRFLQRLLLLALLLMLVLVLLRRPDFHVLLVLPRVQQCLLPLLLLLLLLRLPVLLVLLLQLLLL